MRELLILLMFVMSIIVVSAQNDPGHDTLYIEQQGDSELNGSFNTTENVTIRGGEVEITNQFEIRGNGAIPSTNTNFIVADHDDFISINSKGTGGVIRLQDQVANGMVMIGDGASFANDLNVSNDLYVIGNYFAMDTNFELRTDGTFPSSSINYITVNGTSSNAQMWLTSQEIILARGITNGMVFLGETTSDSVALNVTGEIIGQNNLTILGDGGFIAGSQICTPANGLCTTGSSSGGGWTNTSTLISSNVGVNITMDSGVLFVDATNNEVGVGTTTPTTEFHVEGSSNITGTLYVNGSQVCTSTNGLCAAAGSSGAAGWVNSSTTTSTDLNVNVTGDFYVRNETGNPVLFINNTAQRVGVLTTSPTTLFHVNGSTRIEQNLTVVGGGIYDSGATARVVFDTNRIIINLG